MNGDGRMQWTWSTDSLSDVSIHRALSGDRKTRSLKKELIAALWAAGRAFSIAYGMRTGIAVISRLLSLLRSSPRLLFHLEHVVGESHLKSQVPAVRLGLFIGSFVGIYEVVEVLLDHFAKKRLASRTRTLIAGAFSGLSIFFELEDSRRMIALYSLVRLFQCLYNRFKAKYGWKDSPWGTFLIFALSSAQIMYAYVMRPETLHPGFFKFIVHSG